MMTAMWTNRSPMYQMSHRASAHQAEASFACTFSANTSIIAILDAILMASIIIFALLVLAVVLCLDISLLVLAVLVLVQLGLGVLKASVPPRKREHA